LELKNPYKPLNIKLIPKTSQRSNNSKSSSQTNTDQNQIPNAVRNPAIDSTNTPNKSILLMNTSQGMNQLNQMS
jgi:hypothetical protein